MTTKIHVHFTRTAQWNLWPRSCPDPLLPWSLIFLRLQICEGLQRHRCFLTESCGQWRWRSSTSWQFSDFKQEYMDKNNSERSGTGGECFQLDKCIRSVFGDNLWSKNHPLAILLLTYMQDTGTVNEFSCSLWLTPQHYDSAHPVFDPRGNKIVLPSPTTSDQMVCERILTLDFS